MKCFREASRKERKPAPLLTNDFQYRAVPAANEKTLSQIARVLGIQSLSPRIAYSGYQYFSQSLAMATRAAEESLPPAAMIRLQCVVSNGKRCILQQADIFTQQSYRRSPMTAHALSSISNPTEGLCAVIDRAYRGDENVVLSSNVNAASSHSAGTIRR